MGWFELIAMAGPAVMMSVPGLALPFLYIYLVHDYAGRRQGDRDPLLGAKVFATLIMTLAAQLALAGVAVVAAAAVGDGSPESAFKTGAGLAVAGAIIGVFPAYVYFARVRTHGGARIGHQALGINALVAGLVFAGAVVIACQALVHGERAAEAVAVAAVYGAGMIGFGLRLQRSPIPPAHAQRDRG